MLINLRHAKRQAFVQVLSWIEENVVRGDWEIWEIWGQRPGRSKEVL